MIGIARVNASSGELKEEEGGREENAAYRSGESRDFRILFVRQLPRERRPRALPAETKFEVTLHCRDVGTRSVVVCVQMTISCEFVPR